MPEDHVLIPMPSGWLDAPLKEEFVKSHLSWFGYARDENNQTIRAEELTPEQTLAAIMRFQEHVGLTQDGIVGPKTASVMMAPRCGVREQMLASAATSLWKWNAPRNSKGNIEVAYWVDPQLADVLRIPKTEFESANKEIFEVSWCKYGRIDRVRSNSPVQQYGLNITGARIDGPSSVLADCELPVDGRSACQMRFDVGDNYVLQLTPQVRGILYPNVGRHELGHGDGLPHSRRPNALMAPYYAQAVTHPLDDDDIPRYRARYETRVSETPPGPAPIPPVPTPVPTPTPTPTPGIPPIPTPPTDIRLERVSLRINGKDYNFTVNS